MSLAYPYYHIVIKLSLLYTTLRYVLTEGFYRQIVTIIPCFYIMRVPKPSESSAHGPGDRDG